MGADAALFVCFVVISDGLLSVYSRCSVGTKKCLGLDLNDRRPEVRDLVVLLSLSLNVRGIFVKRIGLASANWVHGTSVIKGCLPSDLPRLYAHTHTV